MNWRKSAFDMRRAIVMLLAVFIVAAGGLIFSFSGNGKKSPSEPVSLESAPYGDSTGLRGMSASSAHAERNLLGITGNEEGIAKSELRYRPSVESGLLSSNGLRVEVIDKLIKGDGFDNVIDKMRLEGDAQAMELTRTYQKNLDAFLKDANSGISLDRLACGRSVCASSFSGQVMSEENFATQIAGSSEKREAKIYSAMAYALPSVNADGETVYRMVFATDPRFNALRVPAR